MSRIFTFKINTKQKARIYHLSLRYWFDKRNMKRISELFKYGYVAWSILVGRQTNYMYLEEQTSNDHTVREKIVGSIDEIAKQLSLQKHKRDGTCFECCSTIATPNCALICNVIILSIYIVCVIILSIYMFLVQWNRLGFSQKLLFNNM